MPFAPPALQRCPTRCLRCSGETGNLKRDSWSTVVFPDVSGTVPSWPELRRCGWGFWQLRHNGAPVRRAWGALP
eukprot:1358739-Pyramimonas_sp.AAC.1